MFCYSEDFETSDLSVGTHTIKFKVKDNDNHWSEYDKETLIIHSKNIPNQKPNAEIITLNTNDLDYGNPVIFHGIGTPIEG